MRNSFQQKFSGFHKRVQDFEFFVASIIVHSDLKKFLKNFTMKLLLESGFCTCHANKEIF